MCQSWKPVDWIAFILAITIALIILANGIARYFTGEPYDPERAKTLAGVIGSVIAILALYIGTKLRGKDGE